MKTSVKVNRYSRHLNKRAVRKKLLAKNANGHVHQAKGINLDCLSFSKSNYGIISGLKQVNLFKVLFGLKEIECKINKKKNYALGGQL